MAAKKPKKDKAEKKADKVAKKADAKRLESEIDKLVADLATDVKSAIGLAQDVRIFRMKIDKNGKATWKLKTKKSK